MLSSEEHHQKGQDDAHGMSTLSIHGHDPEMWSFNPMTLPLVTSTNYKYNCIEIHPEYVYIRHGNPTRDCLQKTVASMEGAKYGICFSSGITSFVACIQLLSPGDAVVCSDVVYGGVSHYLREYSQKLGLEVTFVDAVASPENVRAALKDNTKLVWMEVCVNPILGIVDIVEVTKIVKQHPSNPILVVDNTFLTPCFLKPISLGVDISMHSMTKYMSGHGDILMGCISTNRKDLYDSLIRIQIDSGLVPSPFDCYLMSRSLKTLQLRMHQHSANALAVAQMLESHPSVERVLYPGLPSHPNHKVAKRIMSGYSGMVSCYLKGDKRQAERFLQSLKIASYATSLGSTETLVCLPWATSHVILPEETRRSLGVTEMLIRFSIGIEDIEDILNDIRQALEAE